MKAIITLISMLATILANAQLPFLLTNSGKQRLSDLNFQITFDGNSLTQGTNNSGVDQYISTIVNDTLIKYCKNLDLASFGVNGQRSNQMLNDVQSQISSRYLEGYVNVIIAQESTNAIFATTPYLTGVQQYDNFVEYFNYLQDWQIRILVVEYYPRATDPAWSFYSEAKEAEFTIYANLAAKDGNPWNYYIDLRDNQILGGQAQQAINTTYFNDAAHLQSVGYQIWANEILDLLRIIYIFD